MTRASLLHILDHVTGISEAEVRELEQLATAFPYCQTAHLLLAKAAHDCGSMLASQRLRRAATYATNRELLRQLIETPASAAVPAEEGHRFAVSLPPLPAGEQQILTPDPVSRAEVPAPAVDFAPDAVESASVLEAADAGEAFPAALLGTADQEPEAMELPRISEVAQLPIAETDSMLDEAVSAGAEKLTAGMPLPIEAPLTEPAAEIKIGVAISSPDTVAAASDESATAASSLFDQAEQATEPAAPGTADEEEALPELEAEASEISEALTTDAVVEGLQVELAATAEPVAAASEANTPEEAAGLADELPPVAPPIRPPVEAGSSRFEFGLAEASFPVSAYQLPGLGDEELAAPAADVPAFHADDDLAYALSAGSRFGYGLLPCAPELTHDLPLSDDWYVDAVLLKYLADHQPATPPPPSSIALIDKFLRAQPRMRGAAPRPMINPEPQADLSVRSTSALPSLASESLAKIMVRQGKTARAIEIYEQLMQRQPEKRAYFAAQIDLLNQQTE